MILIFSYFNDTSTTDVIRWLHRFGVRDIVRINESDLDSGSVAIQLRNRSFLIRARGLEFSLEDVEAVWFRKGTLWFEGVSSDLEIRGHAALTTKLNERILLEERKAKEYFHYLLQQRCRVLGNPIVANPNKLIVMHMAAEMGLNVPDLCVSNRIGPLAAFMEQSHARVVTKAISDGLYLWDFEGTGQGYFSYTERLELLKGDGSVSIPLSMVQEEVEKKMEIRSFYLDGDFYSMAIFSQQDVTTAVDYRKYNYENPNRMVPFRLPLEVEVALDKLFRKLKLNTGSVDLILDTQGRYVFLEINPSGQYAGLSNSCNYHLDMKIASWLIDQDGRKTSSLAA